MWKRRGGPLFFQGLSNDPVWALNDFTQKKNAIKYAVFCAVISGGTKVQELRTSTIFVTLLCGGGKLSRHLTA